MANKKFTLEEMEYLRGNEYVIDVTDSCVYFSAAYKAEFYQKLLAGKKAKDIFAESGINTDILGVNRVNGFRSLVLREAKSGKGFRDISTYTEFSGNYAFPLPSVIRSSDQKKTWMFEDELGEKRPRTQMG